MRFADPARTVIDILDDPKLSGGIRHGTEIVVAYLDDHDPAMLIDYADRLGNRTVFKRDGYLVETFGVDAAELTSACLARLPEGVSASTRTAGVAVAGRCAGRPASQRRHPTPTPGVIGKREL